MIVKQAKTNVEAPPPMSLLSDGKLFWEVQLHTIDPMKHYRYVIVRVCERGSWQQFQEILKFYPRDMVVDALKREKSLDRKTASFVSVYLDIPKQQMECYKHKWFEIPPLYS